MSRTLTLDAKPRPMTMWQRVQMAVSFTLIGGAMVYVGLHMTPTKDATPVTHGHVSQVEAPDGTVTINYVPNDGSPVNGMVILPDGTAHTFSEMDDAAAEGRDADEGGN